MGNKIIIAMVLGLIIGFSTQFTLPVIETIGQGFVMLLQMTALPYISVSLIYGIGSMSRKQGKQLIKFGSISFLILLSSVLILIFLAPIAFPDWTAAAFYSASSTIPEEKLNILQLFIPANPFFAYAQTIIPAVVVFSIFVGIGFIRIENKRRSLYVFRDMREALAVVTNLVMKIAPLGVFAISLNASATIIAEELDGLLVYIVTISAIVMLLSFVVLPLLVSILTPLTYKQVLVTAKEPLITAFATGSLFVVLPVIVENVRGQLQEYAKIDSAAKRIPSIIVPISYSLPVGGKLLAILFVLFAGWFSGETIGLEHYPRLMLLGVMQLFGSSMIAVPSLLSSFDVSPSMFELFIVAEQLIISRLGALLSVMFITALSFLVTMMVIKKVKFNVKPFAGFVIAAPLCTAAVLAILSVSFNSISHQYQGYEKFINRGLLLPAAKATYLKEPMIKPYQSYNPSNTLHKIQRRGFIRMGYYRDSLPYAFHNKDGLLVGLDIELGHLLANELKVDIEFVKIFRKQTTELLESGYLDLVSGIPVTPESILKYNLTDTYITEPIALLVKDKDRNKFSHWDNIIAQEDLIIGIPEAFYYAGGIQKNLPNSVVWELATPRLLFKEQGKDIDAMLYGAAGASAWTLLYPNYSVVMPLPIAPPVGIAFPIGKQDLTFARFLNHWIELKRRSTIVNTLYSYWIEGKKPKNFIR
ncbi:cation:dicarboxylase symporter family transporter [Colwelliaceae bacterium BS250]